MGPVSDLPPPESRHDGETLRSADVEPASGVATATPTPTPRESPRGGAIDGQTTHLTGISVAGPSAIGKRLGAYTLKRELGRGGMGIVYLAEDEQLRREVAIKIMLAAEFATERERRRFQREAEAAAGLRHPNIVAVHDIGEESGRTYFTMDAVHGLTLREWVRRRNPSLERAVSVMAKVCDAVGFANARGIIHRDLKPANVIVDDADEPHIMDFGLAKRLRTVRDDDTFTTHEGAVVGTPHYMSPEQAAGKVDEIDVRSDVYSLGVMLYEIVTGDVPFRAPVLTEMIRMIIHDEPASIRRKNPHVPSDLQVVIGKAMAKEPDRRYWTAYALKADLIRWMRREPINARRASVVYRTRKWIERNRILSAALALAAIAGASMLGYARYLEARTRRELQLYADQRATAGLVPVPGEVAAEIRRLEASGVNLGAPGRRFELRVATNAPPVATVTRLIALPEGRAGTRVIVYDLEDADGDRARVRAEWSADGGVTWRPCTLPEAGAGDLMIAGTGIRALWEAGRDLPAGVTPESVWVRVVPRDVEAGEAVPLKARE